MDQLGPLMVSLRLRMSRIEADRLAPYTLNSWLSRPSLDPYREIDSIGRRSILFEFLRLRAAADPVPSLPIDSARFLRLAALLLLVGGVGGFPCEV